MTQVLDEATADDEAEAEAEDETTPEPVTEPEEETPTAQTDIDIEKASGKLANENQRHAKRVAEIMGADFDGLFECRACMDFAAGFVWEQPTAGPIYQPARETEMCPDCLGMGDVSTGAVARNQLIQCKRCGGNGYLVLGGGAESPAFVPTAPLNGGNVEVGPTAAGRSDTDDQWGRQAGHAHWGLPPSSIGG